jgi:hypothetical protein
MQSASFLAFQRALEKGHGRSNCQTLFGIEKIPSDNYIRDMLDRAPISSGSPRWTYKSRSRLRRAIPPSCCIYPQRRKSIVAVVANLQPNAATFPRPDMAGFLLRFSSD